MSHHEEGITSEEYFARLEAGIPYEGPVIDLGYAIKEIIVTPIPVNQSQTQTFWHLNCMNVIIPYSHEHLEQRENINRNNSENDSDTDYANLIGEGVNISMRIMSLSMGSISTYYVHKGEYLKNNELWRYQKKGRIVTRFTKMKNGRFLWDNNLEEGARNIHLEKVAKARKVGEKISVASGVLIGLDIALSGEGKPSHVINGALIWASATTGVGAIVAGVWFIADFGVMGTNYLISGEAKGIGDMIDEQIGTIELYKGLY